MVLTLPSLIGAKRELRTAAADTAKSLLSPDIPCARMTFPFSLKNVKTLTIPEHFPTLRGQTGFINSTAIPLITGTAFDFIRHFSPISRVDFNS